MNTNGRREDGSVLIVAIIAMAVMISVGLATLAFGGGQRHLAAGERVRESSFNLAEAVLNSQVFILARAWPGSLAAAVPGSCSSAATVTGCPNPPLISAQFDDPQYSSATWSTAVQDNGGSVQSFYTSAGAGNQPPYDANGDGKVWVRAQGVVQKIARTVVTQVQTQVQAIPFPRNTLTAGYFATGNKGRKVMVDTNGSSYSSTPAQPGALAVRCSSPPRSACLEYEATKGQVSPANYQVNYPSALHVSANQLDMMRAVAKANNTYYSSGCPASIAGSMVLIESGNCSYGSTYNSLNASGAVVIVNGTLTLTGSAQYYGLVYLANRQSSTGFLLSLGGCARIVGSVMVEGQGGVYVNGCGNQMAFNPSVLGLARGYGDPVPVKSTWREI